MTNVIQEVDCFRLVWGGRGGGGGSAFVVTYFDVSAVPDCEVFW